MAFNETFWVVAGTSAPVIALANLLAVGDGWSLRYSFEIFGLNTKTDPLRQVIRAGTRAGDWLFFVGAVNPILQAGVLLIALASIDDGVDMIPPRPILLVEFFGIAASALCAAFAAKWRTHLRYLERFEASSTPPHRKYARRVGRARARLPDISSMPPQLRPPPSRKDGFRWPWHRR
jgi:hypothetical protein